MKRKINIRGFLQDNNLANALKHAGNAFDTVDMSISLSDKPDDEINNLKNRPDVLIIELDGQQNKTLERVAELLKSNNSQTSTLILLNNSDTDIVRSLMRLHVYDVIPLPCKEEELMKDLEDILNEKQRHLESIKSQVITFMNAKGGSGSTTLAVNTAYLLASKYDAKVCLVDLDIQFGKVALFLDIAPAENIMNALNQPERIDPLYMKALVSHHSSGLDVLASPGALNDISHLTPEAVSSLIDAISENYEYVLIDMPHLVLPWTMEALRKADRNLLVIQGCLSIMKDAKLLLDNLVNFSIDKQHFELINNRDSKHTGMITRKQILELLGKSDCFDIRNDYAVAIEAQETGKPIDKISIGSSINQDIENLAKALKNGFMANEKPASFFSRIFHERGQKK